jgi:hypothetical protein
LTSSPAKKALRPNRTTAITKPTPTAGGNYHGRKRTVVPDHCCNAQLWSACNDESACNAAADPGQPPPDANRVWQKVLQDIEHIFLRYEKGCTSQAAPNFRRFMHAVSQAIFINNEDDLAAAKEWLRVVRGVKEPDKVPAKWFRKHVRRSVPPPEILAQRLTEVYNLYKDDKMHDGRLLFRANGKSAMSKIHAKVMKHVMKGCLSDPPGYNMYFLVRETREGLKTYRTVRSNSQLEGAHLHLRRQVAGSYTGTAYADMTVLLWMHGFNLSIGVRVKGHEKLYTDRTELVAKFQKLEHSLCHTLPFPTFVSWPDLAEDDLEPFGCRASQQAFADLRLSIEKGEDWAEPDCEEPDFQEEEKESVEEEELIGSASKLDALLQVTVEAQTVVRNEIKARESAARISSSNHMAQINNINIKGQPHPVTPVETDAEQRLFWNTVNDARDEATATWESITDAYNQEVVRSVLRADGRILRLKLSGHLDDFAAKALKHIDHLKHFKNNKVTLKQFHATMQQLAKSSALPHIDWSQPSEFLQPLPRDTRKPSQLTMLVPPDAKVASADVDAGLSDAQLTKWLYAQAFASLSPDCTAATLRAEMIKLAPVSRQCCVPIYHAVQMWLIRHRAAKPPPRKRGRSA